MRETNEFVFFWGHADVFSNFYRQTFTHQGLSFRWSEQAVMYRKAKLFGADQVAARILQAQTPMECKKLGRSREIPFDNAIWESHRETIYYEVLIDKFSDRRLKEILLATGERHLVEASPFDTIWGIGLAADHQDAEQPAKWRGLNLLGKVLMRVRTTLQANRKH